MEVSKKKKKMFYIYTLKIKKILFPFCHLAEEMNTSFVEQVKTRVIVFFFCGSRQDIRVCEDYEHVFQNM